MTRRTRTVRTGLGYRLMLFGGLFIVASMLFAVLNGPFDSIITQASANTNSTQAETGIGWVEQAWKHKAFIVAALGAIGITAGAVIESRRP